MKVYFAAALLAVTTTEALADAERGAYLVNAVMTCAVATRPAHQLVLRRTDLPVGPRLGTRLGTR